MCRRPKAHTGEVDNRQQLLAKGRRGFSSTKAKADELSSGARVYADVPYILWHIYRLCTYIRTGYQHIYIYMYLGWLSRGDAQQQQQHPSETVSEGSSKFCFTLSASTVCTHAGGQAECEKVEPSRCE